MPTHRIIHSDCLPALRDLIQNKTLIHAIVCDPPYGLEFMGKEWDGADGFRRSLNPADTGRDNCFGRQSKRGPEYRAGHLFQEWCEEWARLALELLPPGGHLIAFGGTRTYHRLACAAEDAGFEIRDQIQWLYGQGFPKSKNIGDGRGTALKPANEPILLARKPLTGTVEENFQRYGVGVLNIDACRVDDCAEGRWPANVIHDGSDEVVAGFPDAPGQLANVSHTAPSAKTNGIYGPMARVNEASQAKRYTENGSTNFAALPGARRLDSGSAARFFYCAKAPKSDRMGFDHPTIKPVNLMRWLVRLVTPVGGVVLDPFAGTGTTGQAAEIEGRSAILIEREDLYVGNICARLGISRDRVLTFKDMITLPPVGLGIGAAGATGAVAAAGQRADEYREQ